MLLKIAFLLSLNIRTVIKQYIYIEKFIANLVKTKVNLYPKVNFHLNEYHKILTKIGTFFFVI
ncbi:hypothetical protein COL47_28245 [Bacillus toyonensis]|nr:hypothetical protein COL47_28245 [Bacillus toyonensis]